MVTAFGKFCRKLRIENDEILQNMYVKLNWAVKCSMICDIMIVVKAGDKYACVCGFLAATHFYRNSLPPCLGRWETAALNLKC